MSTVPSDEAQLDSPKAQETDGVSFRRGAKRRIIDETLLDEDEAKRLEARRAYNRQCAAKARKRSKDLIAHLQAQVEELSKDKAALERTNEVMQAQLQLLEQQNRTLMMNQHGSQLMQAGQAPLLSSSAHAVTGSGSFPSATLLESLSAQGRLSFQQGDSNLPSMFPRGSSGGGINGSSTMMPF